MKLLSTPSVVTRPLLAEVLDTGGQGCGAGWKGRGDRKGWKEGLPTLWNKRARHTHEKHIPDLSEVLRSESLL